MSESQRNADSNSDSLRDCSRDDAVLERNVDQLIARVHQPPRMSSEARARVLARVKDHARPSDGDKRLFGLSLPSFGRRPAWAAGAVLAVGLAVLGGRALLEGTTSAGPSVYAPVQVKLVALADGSEMILNRGARAVVTGERRVRVERGEVLFEVAKGKGRFIVESPHGQLRVLGTRFVVDVSDSSAGQTRASVVRGRVEIENRVGSAVLHAGEEAVLRDGKAPVRRRAPRLSHLAGWAKLAKRQDEKPAAAPVRRGTLIARNPNWQQQEFSLPMRSLTVDVHVDNQIARVALDQTFFNSQNQQLEGVYHLALPADASIYRQAMYVNGKRMESGIVERSRAREIYDDIVYQARDPALMEWMVGNLYKVRIFPILARTEKRIVFGYTQPLSRLYGDYRLEVPLPAVDSPVQQVRYNVRLAGCASCKVASTSHEMSSSVDGDDLVVSYSAEMHSIGDDLVLTVHDPRTAPRVVRAARGDNRYLMVRAQPLKAEAAGGSVISSEHRKRRWVILHDTSASRQALDLKAQSHLIDQFLRQLDEDDEVQLMAFDARIRHQSESFQRVGDVDRRKVAAFLARESADAIGYTDLAAALRAAASSLAEAGSRSKGNADAHILYLGDGIVTAGERSLERLRRAVEGKATFVGIAVGERMDMAVLRELANITGGMTAVMNPGDDLSWRAFDLVAALSTARVVDLVTTLVDAEGKAVAGEVYPSARQISDGEELMVVARTEGSRAVALQLRGRLEGEAWSRRIELGSGKTGDAAYLPRFWAQARVAHLLTGEREKARAEITKLGKQHFLVTPFTSLLVLENEAMYAQYKVERDRSKRWAAYALPDSIKVVREPHGAVVGAVAHVPLDAILLRTPTEALRSRGYSSYRGADLGGLGGESLSLGFAGDDDGESVIGMGSFEGLTVATGGAVSTADASGSAAAVPVAGSTRAAKPAADLNGVRGGGAIVTAQDFERRGDSWNLRLDASDVRAEQGNLGSRGMFGRRARKSGERGRFAAYQALQDKSVDLRGRGLRRTAGNLSRGEPGRGYVGWAAPQPVAYHYPGDVRLDDLTEHVPGLFANSFDVQMRALAAAAGSRAVGSITRDARELIEASRKRVGNARFTSSDGASIMNVDRRAGLRVERRLEVGLGEEVVYDGAWLYHLYPQLGIATRRAATEESGAAALVYDRWAPFLLAPAAALERLYDVTRPAPLMLRLAPAGTTVGTTVANENRVIEILLDDDRRVREIARVQGTEREVLLSATWKTGSVVLSSGGRSTTMSFEKSESLGGVDSGAWAVVPMPLRQPAYLEKRLAANSGPTVRVLQRQLLASWAALGNTSKMVSVAQSMAADEPLSRGELALLSRAARQMGDAQLRAVTKGSDKSDPVAGYLRASRSALTGSRAFDRLSTKHAGFVGTMAAYRGIMAQLWGYSPGQSKALATRIGKLIEREAAPLFLYIVAHRYANTFGYQRRKETLEVWDMVADAMPSVGWRSIARVESARSLYSRGRYDDAAERYQRLLAELPADAAMPPLDNTAQHAFRNSGHGEAGWRLFWAKWRDQGLRRGDIGSLLSLVGSAGRFGQVRDLDRVSARIIDLGDYQPEVALQVARALQQVGRSGQALATLEAQLSDDEPDLLALASSLAEQQGKLAEAASYFERALAAYGDGPVALSVARADHQRLLRLLVRLSMTSGGAARKTHIERAVSAAARWRQLDPDNDAIDQQMARGLYAVGRPEDAWRYLSSVIERHPGEGSAYKAVAVVLEEEGQAEHAAALWQRAVDLDPEDPTWLLRWANALYASGDPKDRAQAAALIDQIAAKEWHARFRQIVWRAKRLKQQRK